MLLLLLLMLLSVRMTPTKWHPNTPVKWAEAVGVARSNGSTLQWFNIFTIDDFNFFPNFFFGKFQKSEYEIIQPSILLFRLKHQQFEVIWDQNSNLCTMTTLGTLKKWLMLTDGRCSEVIHAVKVLKMVVVTYRWSLFGDGS